MLKRLLLALFLTSPVLAGTSTTNLSLYKPTVGETGWGTSVNNNFDIIDSSMVTRPGSNAFTGYNSFTSSVAFSSSTFNRIWIASPTYSISTDKLAVNGALRVGGGSGAIYACDSNFQNCSSLSNSNGLTLANSAGTSLFVSRDATATGGIAFISGAIQGAYVITGSNIPGVFSADRLLVGPTIGDRLSNTVDPSGTRSAIENALYVGTHTVAGTPQFAVRGSTNSTYSVLIGTAVALSATNYHFAISTSGNSIFHGGVGLWNVPIASINTLTAETTGQMLFCKDCTACGGKGTICVSTGSVSPGQFVLSTGTRCQ